MKEIRNIILEYGKLAKAQRPAVLATLVHLEGSSYRRPGARMLVSDTGAITGAISGGCLEGDALQKALLVMSQQQSRIVTYDTMEDDDAFGVGLGCNGIIHVLMEPVRTDDRMNPAELLRKATAVRQKSVLVTLFRLGDKKGGQPGTCLLLDESGNVTSNLQDERLKQTILEDAKEVMRNEKSAFLNYRKEEMAMTAFIEYLPPGIALVVVGAGNDAIPLVGMADILGWDLRIVDGRASHARKERFTAACQVLVSRPEDVLAQIPIDPQTVFVLMTHNYNFDKAMLKELVRKDIRYIGMLGPGKKLRKMLEEIRHEGQDITEDQLRKIHSPVGLDIGAEHAEEIALAILAEIKSVLSDKPGGSLRLSADFIHPRIHGTVPEKTIS